MPRVALVVSLLLLTSACGGGGDASGDGGPGDSGDGDGAPLAEQCPLDVLDSLDPTDKPVEVMFWHQLQSTNEEALQAQTDRFNESQDDVHVSLLYQGEELLTKYKAGLSTGALPTMLQLEETNLQAMVDSGGTIPAQACVDASDFPVDDFLPRAITYYTLDGALRSVPWNISNPVLYYMKSMFEAAGLDPDDPPETFDEMREYSQQIVDSGVAPHGVALHTSPYINEFWFAKNGEIYANNGNGRDGRATAANLDSPTGLAVWEWRDEMVDSGLAINTGRGLTSPDDLLAVAGGEAAMAMGGSSAVGPIVAVLSSGQYGGDPDRIGVAPLPGVEPDGGVETAEGSLYLVKGSPEQIAASWRFIEFLTDTEQVVELHLKTGYVPVRISAVEDPRIQEFWTTNPNFRVAYDQLTEGPESDATAGAVIGDFQGVRDAVQRSWEAMHDGKLTPEAAIAQAQREADAAIQDYNERLGL